mgnify:CR=1 FL=1
MMACERPLEGPTRALNPCQASPHLKEKTEDCQCLQGIWATKACSVTKNGLFDVLAGMLYPRACAVPLLHLQGSPAPWMPGNGPYNQTGRSCRAVCQLNPVVHLAAFCAVFAHTSFQAAQRCDAVPFSRFSQMAFTHFSVVGVSQTVLEGFAGFIADDHGCQWSVRPKANGETYYYLATSSPIAEKRRFELSFDCEIGALKAARVQRSLKAMGATDCACITGQTRPRVVLPSL